MTQAKEEGLRFRELKVPGAWEVTPRQFHDDRGTFLEMFKEEQFAAAVGHSLNLAQANFSVSSVGVLRGIHFADVPPGQAKYVTSPKGAVLDVAVDLRLGSPTFGEWDSVLLDDVDRKAIYLAEGLGHAFLSLEDESTVMYVCSVGYAPQRERSVHALDPGLVIVWPTENRDGRPLQIHLSDKDQAAPTLVDSRESGHLPQHSEVLNYVDSLKS